MKKQLKRITVLSFITVFSLILFIMSCSNPTPFENIACEESGFSDESSILAKRPVEEYTYPIWGKKNFYNKRGTWEGGSIQLSNGSTFAIERGAMTPPHPLASSYYLTVRADFDSLNNQIIVSFTPGGCVFDPPAELILDWTDLGIEVASLYYINENGDYIPQTPDHINFDRRTLSIYIDHFSRYAIGMD